MRIKKGDNVYIMSGKDKGKSGTVSAVLQEKDRVLVKDMNLVKKRRRATKQNEKGQTVEVARSIHSSNVMLVCKNCKKPTRTGYRIEGDNKVRYCKQCEAAN